MNGSSHIRSGLTRPVAKLLYLTIVGTLSFAQAPAVANPNQAVLLDGSTDASDVFAVAFTDNGLQFAVVTPPALCPDTSHVPQAGIFQASLEEAGVYPPGRVDGTRFVVAPPFSAGYLPLNVDDLYDDCEVGDNLAQVLVYLDQANLEATEVLDEIDDCVQSARAAYCLLIELIEDAELFVPAITAQAAINGNPPGESSIIFPGSPQDRECVHFLVILESMPQALDSMGYKLSGCQALRSGMTQWAARIVTDGYVEGSREGALAAADRCMSEVEERYTQANQTRIEIAQLSSQFTSPSVEESCEECAQSPREDPLIPLSGAVAMQTDRAPLDRYVTAFLDAASETDDPDLGLRLSDIAIRLEEIPDGRVMHLTFASTSAIDQDFLALHASDAPDDGDSPLAVLLTAVNPSPPLPPMNAADERLLFDGYEAFLLRVGGTTQGIPAVSVWGLVAMALLVLTTGTVVYARRHPPQT